MFSTGNFDHSDDASSAAISNLLSQRIRNFPVGIAQAAVFEHVVIYHPPMPAATGLNSRFANIR